MQKLIKLCVQQFFVVVDKSVQQVQSFSTYFLSFNRCFLSFYVQFKFLN